VREVRFLNWIAANDSDQVTWADRPRPGGPYMGRGQAIEYMVQLANEIGADAWFTIPHLADADYIRQFATYVRDHLDPRLQVRVEWSNEVWNGQFQQHRWAREQSQALWGVDEPRDYSVKMATRTAQIWKDVFQGADAARLQTVLGSFVTNPWYTQKLLEADVWKQNEPAAWVAPANTFDAVAVTTYFGGTLARDGAERAAFLRVLDQGGDINGYLAGRLRDPQMRSSVPQVLEFLAAHADVARSGGLDLLLYEGGQHVHAAIGPKARDQAQPTTPEDIARMHNALIAFVRSPEMADLYRDMWQGWARIGQGPFMQYSDVTGPSKFGSFGLYANLQDRTPRSVLLTELNRSQTPWWDAAPGAQYQQGGAVWGTDQADQLQGTVEEDYLIGAGGDDIFYVSASRDGLHGGVGQDTAIFPRPISAYVWQRDGAGLRVIGPDSDTLLVAIETFSFADGASRSAEAMGG
jgi:hypothetical protein